MNQRHRFDAADVLLVNLKRSQSVIIEWRLSIIISLISPKCYVKLLYMYFVELESVCPQGEWHRLLLHNSLVNLFMVEQAHPLLFYFFILNGQVIYM